jgi:hypothetical protein
VSQSGLCIRFDAGAESEQLSKSDISAPHAGNKARTDRRVQQATIKPGSNTAVPIALAVEIRRTKVLVSALSL